jgi:hypothetical protein
MYAASFTEEGKSNDFSNDLILLIYERHYFDTAGGKESKQVSAACIKF